MTIPAASSSTSSSVLGESGELYHQRGSSDEVLSRLNKSTGSIDTSKNRGKIPALNLPSSQGSTPRSVVFTPRHKPPERDTYPSPAASPSRVTKFNENRSPQDILKVFYAYITPVVTKSEGDKDIYLEATEKKPRGLDKKGLDGYKSSPRTNNELLQKKYPALNYSGKIFVVMSVFEEKSVPLFIKECDALKIGLSEHHFISLKKHESNIIQIIERINIKNLKESYHNLIEDKNLISKVESQGYFFVRIEATIVTQARFAQKQEEIKKLAQKVPPQASATLDLSSIPKALLDRHKASPGRWSSRECIAKSSLSSSSSSSNSEGLLLTFSSDALKLSNEQLEKLQNEFPNLGYTQGAKLVSIYVESENKEISDAACFQYGVPRDYLEKYRAGDEVPFNVGGKTITLTLKSSQ